MFFVPFCLFFFFQLTVLVNSVCFSCLLTLDFLNTSFSLAVTIVFIKHICDGKDLMMKLFSVSESLIAFYLNL